MKWYPSIFLYGAIIFFSFRLVLSSNNWFIMWIGLELSMFGFIPLLSSNSLSSEGIFKYFFIQAGASRMFLISFLLDFSFKHFIIFFSMIIKLGLFPFYQWLPFVISSLR